MSEQPFSENGQDIGGPSVAECIEDVRANLGLPGGSEPPMEPRRCARCNEPAPAGTDRCPRCQSWLMGNRGALRSGVYASHVPDDLRFTANQLMDGIISDLGGIEEL